MLDLLNNLLFRKLLLFIGIMQSENGLMQNLVPAKVKQLHEQIAAGSFLALARAITMVENELVGYEQLLLSLHENRRARVVGITGPPGAGKSTLVNALLHYWVAQNMKIAVIAVDPSSPFNYGTLLGDRIRMSEFYTHPNVFIRSLATRGALGGLSVGIIEITDVVKEAPFDVVLVETVGVGQSEVEIAGLADCTVVALVPEGGDEVQTLKAGIMEIADIFVVNKADREGAEGLFRNLRMLVHERATDEETPVLKTTAVDNVGIGALGDAIFTFLAKSPVHSEKRMQLLAEKCWHLIQKGRMKGVDQKLLRAALERQLNDQDFNLYAFANAYIASLGH